ncbi:MAG: ComEC/Rec2 family competence protein [Candidatus Staskawiczbacteria bacterium]
MSLFVKRINFIWGFCLLFLVLGILRMQITEFNIANDELSKYNDAGLITLTGIISNEPDIRDAYQKIKVKIDDSTILVTTNRYPEYKYLDTIKLTGKLETPSETEEFSYKNYLMKDGIYSVMGFPKMEVISQEHKHNILTYLYEKILFCKQKIRESIQKNFLPPQSLIMEGTILGNNGAMTQDLKNKLNITGLRHIIAVSGTHVVILSAIIMNVLLGMGLWRGQAFYVSIIFICIYIVLTGLPPSGVRAGIMGGTYLLSQKIGRQTMGYRLIMLACAIMLLINPMLLFYDVGFQLSFLAVVGLIYLEPIIKRFIKIFTKQKVENFVGIVSTTFAAQIFTLPIMIYNFGNISFVSPITNLLILPSVYGLMVFGFLASILGVFSSVLGWILSIPCWILLNYFVWIMDFFSQPWMAKNIENVSWVWLFILYFIIVVGTTFLNKKYKQSLV